MRPSPLGIALLCASSAFGASIDGRVINAATNEAVPAATVSLTCLTETTPTNSRRIPYPCKDAETKTLESGAFHFDRLNPGRYRLAVAATTGLAATRLSQTETIVDWQHSASEIVLKLSPESTISGKVIDEMGQPKPDTAVEALRVFTSAAGSELRLVSKTVTNQDGSYVLRGLMSGNYYIATPLDHEDTNDPTHPYLFFASSAVGLDQAAAIHVETGQSYADAEIHLRPVVYFKIQGRAQMETVGSAASDKPQLYLDARDGSGVALPARNVLLNPDGSFQTEALPGSYTLRLEGALTIAQPANQRKAPSPAVHLLAKQDIEVSAKDLLSVTLLIPPPITVTGHALLEGTSEAVAGKGRVLIKPAEAFAIGGPQTAEIQPDGTFTLTNCDPVSYSVRVFPPSGTYVKSIVFNQQDISNQLMDLSKGSGGELTVTVRQGMASIAGTISDASSTAEGSTLFDIAFIPDGWVPTGLVSIRHAASKEGHFSAANLPPGHYNAVATTGVDAPLWEIASFVHALAERGAGVEVTANDQKNLTVPFVTFAEINELRMHLGLD